MTQIDEPSSVRRGLRAPRPDWIDDQLEIAARPMWWGWSGLLRYGAPLISLFGRMQLSGEVPERLRDGPVLLAANHIGNFDVFFLAAAIRRAGLFPRFVITAGLMTAPIVGPFLARSGNIRVNRGKADAGHSLEIIRAALDAGGHVVVYPEGRISLDPNLWPERGRSGLARLALQTRVPVIPVAQWGAHSVTTYTGPLQMATSTLSSIWRQPALKVHFGEPVYLDDLGDRVGDAYRAQMRIMGAITREVRRLRGPEIGPPDFADPTRPTVATGTAAFRDGLVPDTLP